MAYTTIKKPSDYFNTKLYTGNNSTNIISGVGFQPDWFWIKDRSTTGEKHHLFDAVRGLNKALYSNQTTAETTGFDGGGQNNITAVGNDGFTITGNGSDGEGNLTGRNYASWNWKANGAGVANTDGDIASTVSANTTSGFSIVSYTGNGSAGATVGHGLGTIPAMVIQKRRSGSIASWVTWHQSIHSTSGNSGAVFLNLTNANATGNSDAIAGVSSTLITTAGTGAVNPSGDTCIMYCFAEKQGFSKFGSYTGNGSTDGTFVYTGFKPAFVIYKGASGTGTTDNWEMADNKRSPYNGIENVLYPNENYAEGTGVTTRMDFLSNGFKMRTSGSDYNASGSTYIYMAFAEQPLVGDNPATAR